MAAKGRPDKPWVHLNGSETEKIQRGWISVKQKSRLLSTLNVI